MSNHQHSLMIPSFAVLVRASVLAAFALFCSAALAAASVTDQARSELGSGRVDKAIELLNQAIEDDPDNLEAILLQGVAYAQKGDMDRAEGIFTRLTQLNGNVPPAYNNLAAIQASRGDFEQARSTLIHATQRFPNYRIAHENLADLHATMAAIGYQRALKLDPGNLKIQSKLDALGRFIKVPVTTLSAEQTTPISQTVVQARPEQPRSKPKSKPRARPKAVVKQAKASPSKAVASGPRCPVIGPVSNDATTLNLENWLDQLGVSYKVSYAGNATSKAKTMVFIPPSEDFSTAKTIKNDLLSNGVTDLGIIRGGDLANAISLGVFSQQASVNRRLEQLRALGFEPSTRLLGVAAKGSVVRITTPGALSADELRSQFPGLKVSEKACP